MHMHMQVYLCNALGFQKFPAGYPPLSVASTLTPTSHPIQTTNPSIPVAASTHSIARAPNCRCLFPLQFHPFPLFAMRTALVRIKPQFPTAASICIRCQLLTHPLHPTTSLIRSFTTTTAAPADATSEKPLSLDERLKRKLWGRHADEIFTPGTGNQTELGVEEENMRRRKPMLRTASKEFGEGYAADLDARGLRVVGLVDKLGKKNGDWKLESYIPSTKITDPAVLTRLTYETVISVYTTILHNLPASHILTTHPDPTSTSLSYWTSKVTVTRDASTGEISFDYGSQDVINGILGRESAAAKAEEKNEMESKEGEQVVDEVAEEDEDEENSEAAPAAAAAEQAQPSSQPSSLPPAPATDPNAAWLHLPLHNPTVKFSIIKRLLNLTGHLLSDNVINSITTVQSLLSALLHHAASSLNQTKLQKLDLVAKVPEIAELGNVKVYKQRLRPLEKEKEKGRLSPAQIEMLVERQRRERGEVEVTEIDKWRYGWEKEREARLLGR